MLKETSSKKKHFQNDSRIIFSSIFNFVVISRLKCNLKINFSYWKFKHFKKDSAYLSSFDFFNFSNHNCQRIFWTWWILSSDVWIKLILVSKLFLSLVNTRNNKKNHQIQGFQNLSVYFFFRTKSSLHESAVLCKVGVSVVLWVIASWRNGEIKGKQMLLKVFGYENKQSTFFFNQLISCNNQKTKTIVNFRCLKMFF